MKEQVENLLENKKKQIIADKKQKKDDHLIRIGLFSERTYHGILEKKALDVTDEEYAEICKYFPLHSYNGKENKNMAERILKVIAITILIMSVITFITCSILLYFYAVDLEEFLFSFGGFIFSFITWAFLRVICNISNNLRELNEKTKYQ